MMMVIEPSGTSQIDAAQDGLPAEGLSEAG